MTPGNVSSGGFSFTSRLRCACGYFVRHFFSSLKRFAGGLHDPQNLQRADDAVAGRGEVAKDHVAALFAAEIQILPHHLLDHVAVADFRPKDLAAMRRERFVEPEVAHHGGDKGILSQLSAAQQIDRGDGENFVAIHDLALLIAKQDAISVAIVGNPDLAPLSLTSR